MSEDAKAEPLPNDLMISLVATAALTIVQWMMRFTGAPVVVIATIPGSSNPDGTMPCVVSHAGTLRDAMTMLEQAGRELRAKQEAVARAEAASGNTAVPEPGGKVN